MLSSQALTTGLPARCRTALPPLCSSLSNMGLTGTLPASLDLPELKELLLNSNQLDGTLPPALSLGKLQVRA